MARNYKEHEKLDMVREFLDSPLGLVDYAKSKGMCHKTVQNAVKTHRHQVEYDVKDDQRLTGVSKYTSWKDEQGQTQAQWVKTDIKHEALVDRLKSVGEGLIENIRPISPKVFNKTSNESLLSNYIISDFHLGQYSSLKETGESWSIDEAFEVVCSWIDRAIAGSPDSEQAVLCDLGDWLHQDGLLPLTPASKHVLDSSGRFFDHIDASIAAFDYMIEKLLGKHKNVHVIICEGNHNETSAHWMSRCIARKYELEPRISFDLSDIPYYSFEWGNTSLYYHHGHKKRINQVSESLIANFREIYGKTKYHYAHVGHLHHREIKESALMVVEQHSTLAAKDAYSARGGYHSERGANTITYHKKFGEVGRLTIRPEMLS